jgi:anti-sigma factor RsiW
MANCPNDEDIACYIEGLLSVSEVRQLERHLISCDRCRDIVVVTKKVVDWVEG